MKPFATIINVNNPRVIEEKPDLTTMKQTIVGAMTKNLDDYFTQKLYEAYKGTEVSKVFVIGMEEFERFLKKMLPMWAMMTNDDITFSDKDGELFRFKPSGVDGIYVCDRAVLKAPFDKKGNNDWEKSSGKKKLKRWFKEHAPAEIQEQFDIDLPTVEEVFSQKMLNWWGSDSVKGLVSKQFPIFKDSDERMKEFKGKPTWWWTRSAALAGDARAVWSVDTDGYINYYRVDYALGFVPVLRRKQQEPTKPTTHSEKK